MINKGHSSGVESVAFSPDGTKVASCGSDTTIKIWDFATGRELRTLQQDDTIKSVAFHKNGKWLASGSHDHMVRIWDLETGALIKTMNGHNDWITSVAFSPDGNWLASGSHDRTIRIWSVSNWHERRKLVGHTNHVNDIAFSADGRTLISGSWDDTIRVWDVDSGKERQCFAQPGAWINTVAFNSDNTKVASDDNSESKAVNIWNLKTGKIVQELTGATSFHAIEFSPDGNQLVRGGTDNELFLWDLKNGDKPRILKGHTDQVKCVAYSNDGKFIASGGLDNTVRLWSVPFGKLLRTFSGRTTQTDSLALSADGQRLFSGCHDNLIRVWDLESREDLTTRLGHNGAVHSVAVTADGSKLVSGDWNRALSIWDVKNGNRLHSITDLHSWVQEVAVSPDNLTLACGLNNGVHIYDIATAKRVKFLEGVQSCCVAFSPEGKTLASGNYDKVLKLWDTKTWKLKSSLPGFSSWVDCVRFSPDEKTFAAAADENITVFATDTNRVVMTLKGHKHPVGTLAFSSDSKLLASGGSDNKVVLWNLVTGKSLFTFSGPTHYITSVIFSKNNDWVAASSGDGAIRFWSTADGKKLCTICPLGQSDWVAVDNEGRFDASNLDNLTDLHWMISKKNEVVRTLPIEIFMRQYYTPRLLGRALSRQAFPKLPSITSLNRAQPTVEIRSVTGGETPDTVKIEVAYKSIIDNSTSSKPRRSGVYDLRLFRDGKLVAYAPLDESFSSEKSEDLTLGEDGKTFSKSFVVRIPRFGSKSTTFSAFAFNDDKVKSATSTFEYKGITLAPRKGKAYVIGMGVNTFEDSRWNLKYAAADARGYTSILANDLKATGQFEVVVPVTLVSVSDEDRKEGELPAVKESLRTVLEALAGKQPQQKKAQDLLQGLHLEKVQPEDLVVLAISSHGDTNTRTGEFFLFPNDLGALEVNSLNADLERHAISTAELTDWLRDVDAGQIAMIIDSCHSAAAEGQDFKPGPMDSRGLGQLAYYKRMRLLSASEADSTAKERGDLKHGLLTYALLIEGLERCRADGTPTDGKITLSKWLRFGEAEVPRLDAGGDTTTIIPKDAIPIGTALSSRVQRPKLLDFTRKSEDLLIKLSSQKN